MNDASATCILSRALFFLALGLCALPARASHSVKEDLKVPDLPPAARRIVEDEIKKGATLRVIHAVTEEEDGRTWFVVRVGVNGHGKELNFDPKGKILSVEEEVSMESVPIAVRDAIKKSIPSEAKVEEVEADTESDGDVSYHIGVHEPKTYAFDASGKIDHTLTVVPLETLPVAIRDGIKKLVGNGVPVHGNQVEVRTENGESVYMIQVRFNGLRSKLYVDAAGRPIK